MTYLVFTESHDQDLPTRGNTEGRRTKTTEHVEQYRKCATRTQFKILVPLESSPSNLGPSPFYDNTSPRLLRRLDWFWRVLEVGRWVLLGGIVGFRYLHGIFGLYLCNSCRREAGWMEIEGILAVIGGGGRFSYMLCTHLFVP